jgi:hypothetical protein
MSNRDIIQQGDWGYGDTKGLAKAVDVGYRKWLKKNGLEPEGYGGKSQETLKGRKSFSYGDKTKS